MSDTGESATRDKTRFSVVVKRELCELKSKCALSLILLCMLFIEAIIRRVEEIIRNRIQPT